MSTDVTIHGLLDREADRTKLSAIRALSAMSNLCQTMIADLAPDAAVDAHVGDMIAEFTQATASTVVKLMFASRAQASNEGAKLAVE